jgi:hypothetical protein
MVNRRKCFKVMDRASYYRDRANHARQLAEAVRQPDLKDALRRLAQDYDEIAEDLETGAAEIRHSEVLN